MQRAVHPCRPLHMVFEMPYPPCSLVRDVAQLVVVVSPRPGRVVVPALSLALLRM
jgi:hypothetical protein